MSEQRKSLPEGPHFDRERGDPDAAAAYEKIQREAIARELDGMADRNEDAAEELDAYADTLRSVQDAAGRALSQAAEWLGEYAADQLPSLLEHVGGERAKTHLKAQLADKIRELIKGESA